MMLAALFRELVHDLTERQRITEAEAVELLQLINVAERIQLEAEREATELARMHPRPWWRRFCNYWGWRL